MREIVRQLNDAYDQIRGQKASNEQKILMGRMLVEIRSSMDMDEWVSWTKNNDLPFCLTTLYHLYNIGKARDPMAEILRQRDRSRINRQRFEDRRISIQDIQALAHLGYSADRIGRMDIAGVDHILYCRKRAGDDGE